MSTSILRTALTLLLLSLTACGKDEVAGSAGPTDPTNVPRVFVITPGDDATVKMVEATVSAQPGDTIEFGCGFFNLKTTLQLSNTEAITVKGCGRDKTVLSFRESNGQVGILASSVRGLVVRDLTVADTDGNGIELRAVNHGTISHVRTFWSTAGGRESTDSRRLTADNYKNGVMNVACTQPATLDPRSLENEGLPQTRSPDYTVSDKAGRYGVYPVSSENILIEHTESIGASDAGIYVGQTNNTIIRNSRAAFNVFGFEIENVQGGEYHDNVAECNTGGFLIYDLDGNLRQYGDRTRMYRNIARKNNTYNFTEGGFVANVPPGSGMITLSYDRIDVFENTFEDNNTGGIIHASYELFPEGAGRPTEKRIDFYTEGMHIFDNTFRNNGNALPRATLNDLYGGKVSEIDPAACAEDPEECAPNPDVARLLPALVGFKALAACANPTNLVACAKPNVANPQANTGYRGAHIVWDGLLDALDPDCDYPKRPDGTDVPKDVRGKPQHNNQDQPTCHYNAYKFEGGQTGSGQRILPDWWASCIDANNTFSGDSLTFVNFKGLKGLNTVVGLTGSEEPSPATLPALLAEAPDFPGSLSLLPHDCPTAYGKNMPRLPAVVIPPFVRGATDPAASPERIRELCEKPLTPGVVNFDAAIVNCPLLHQYNLFSDPEDPTSAPNSSPGTDSTRVAGVPFVLNSKLFSDYSVKYRVLYMPEGSKATYKDTNSNGKNATLDFPDGTIVAKTFAFLDDQTGVENVVETRLLIRRVNKATRDVRWDGFSYIWGTEGGRRVARLARAGGTAAVSWDYRDADSGQRLQGSTGAYSIPNANQCLSCHSRFDSEPGSAPIGLKVRNLNRPYESESSKDTGQSAHEIAGQNQVDYLCNKGLVLGCPGRTIDAGTKVATNLERMPVWNVAGSGGQQANSAADIESRAKAYLEVNCQHCHNVEGYAASTGLYLSFADTVGPAFGICKRPTATGSEGSNGYEFDIKPADAAHSILAFRIGPDATSPAARMPPLARSVVHTEGHALIEQWIRDVIVVDETKYPNSSNCGS